MRLLRVLRQRARSLFRGAKADAELARELAFHLEQLTRENIANGMEPAQARFAARRALGGLAQIEEQCRDHRRIGWLTDLLKDFTYAWRTLAKSPGFAAPAVVTLALGVGASIAVYALSEALLLRSLPYPEPERLVRITDVHVRQGASGTGQENFRDWQVSNTVFERMAFTDYSQVTLTGYGGAERIEDRAVSEGFFEMLGVQPQLGRWFTSEEQKIGAACVAMVSHGFWLRKLGGRPETVGITITLNDRPCRVTGIMPENFRFNNGGIPEYWSPIDYVNHNRKQHQYSAYARLRRGVSVQIAQAQMSEIAGRLAMAYPDDAGWDVRVRSMRAELLEQVGPKLLIFGAAALIVLLVACANVASLLLARGIGRSREIAVRVALGAGRARVIRLLLAESLLLSGMSAALGVAFAAWLLRLAISAAPPWMQLGDAVSVSASLAIFAVGLTLCTGLLAGLWPALRGSRAHLESELKESGGPLVAGRRQVRSLNGLVVMEIALSVVLLTFAGLLAKSLTHLLETNLGYRTDHVLTFRVPLPASRYRTAAARIQFWDTLLPQLAAVPGVLSAAASDSIPLGGTFNGAPVEVEGQTNHRDWADVTTRGAIVTPDYFRTMGIGLSAGRTFIAGDTVGAEPVVVVNEAFVRKLLPGRTPIGTRVRIGSAPWARIVGMIGDERYFGPAARPEAEAYMPYTLAPHLQFVSIHTAVPEQGVLAEVRRMIRQLDPGLPLTQVRTMRQSMDLSISLERQMMTVVAGFGIVTLVMATMGLSGVMLYIVSRRRREIGLRIALGARPGDISRGVLGSAARLVTAGSAIGLLAALSSGRVLQSLLYGVRWYDPAALAAAPAVLAVIAFAACLLPSRRAAAVEPMQALRQE
jgi:putative ABC transport system permease protein